MTSRPSFSIRGVAFLALLTLLAGCAVQQVRLETPADYVAANYATIQGVSNALKARTASGLVSPERAREIQAVLETAFSTTETAESFLSEDGLSLPSNQYEFLRSTNRILLQLETELREKTNE